MAKYGNRNANKANPKVVAFVFAYKWFNEEEPNILDVVKHREIDLVVNTPTKGNDSNRDGFLIRRAAVERNLGVITALDTLRAIADVELEKFDETKNLEVFDIAGN